MFEYWIALDRHFEGLRPPETQKGGQRGTNILAALLFEHSSWFHFPCFVSIFKYKILDDMQMSISHLAFRFEREAVFWQHEADQVCLCQVNVDQFASRDRPIVQNTSYSLSPQSFYVPSVTLRATYQCKCFAWSSSRLANNGWVKLIMK